MERKYWKSQGKVEEICQSEIVGAMLRPSSTKFEITS